MTRDEIAARLTQTLHDVFEIDFARITPEAKLYEDLDIDSIDAIDLIVRMKPMVGNRLQPKAFAEVRTVKDVVDALHNLMQAESTSSQQR